MTFSLAARCRTTGMVGAVVTTSSPAVGARCPHARAGVGVVLTQHWTDPRLGPRGLALLAEGMPAPNVATALAASTPDSQWRQFAVLSATGDAHGGTAFFHGARVMPVLGAATGPDSVAIGNILANDQVPAAMVDAFERSASPFPERLLEALEAGEQAGGEGKPVVSAALLVAWTAPFPYVDLRVDAAPAPIPELRRVWDAYKPLIDLYPARALEPGTQPRTVPPADAPRA